MDKYLNQIICGDCLEVMKGMPDKCVHCCVTSPPYWGLRDYGVDGQLGLEPTPEEYVSKMVQIFREVRRVLRDDGTLWLNLGDSYISNPRMDNEDTKYGPGRNRIDNPNRHRIDGLKPKDLVGIPWRVAFALQADGWYLRSDLIWHKKNPMPESVKDRPTKAHEYIFLMSKSPRYYYDADAIREEQEEYERNRRLREKKKGIKTVYTIASDGKTGQVPQSISGSVRNAERRQELAENGFRNKRSVWTVATQPFSEAHFATFPPKLIEPCILAGCPEGGIVADPFMGSGTVAIVAERLRRQYVGCDLNPKYNDISERRIAEATRQERMFV